MSIYSAGLMSQSFWFVEFKKVVKLISEGKSLSQVKDISIKENLFGAANAYRARRIAGYLVNRASTLDQTEVRLFAESDVATQKLLNIIAILRTDRLFFEFLFEVYREKVILGIPTIDDSDASIFFKNKEVQSAEIEAWKDTTKKKLQRCYFNYMIDANLLVIDERVRRITPPILDAALERHLEANGEESMIKAITGVN